MRHFLIGSVILAIPATAQATPVQPSSDRQIAAALAPGETIEGRIDGDFNGDGDIDTAFVTTGPDARIVHVLFAPGRKPGAGSGAGPVPLSRFKLPPDPLGPAELSVNGDVLIIRDLTGGTTALAATYRFRGEKMGSQMRLIGLDATSYSRTYAHDGREMSWNLLTGDVITVRLAVAGSGQDANYAKVGAKRMRRPIAIIHMDDTPGAEEELAAAIPPQ